MNFTHSMPTRIIFGRGLIAEVGPFSATLGRSALILTGRHSARQSGALHRACESLASAGVEAHVFDRVSANPMSNEIDAASTLARLHACSVLVGLGGGSAMDAAKACAVSVHLTSVRELIGRNVPDNTPALPVIAIPTTAGSGAEVTKGAIIQDSLTGFKSGVRGNRVYPSLAIIDPELSAGMPQPVALETAFDAFSHAFETYVCRGATPITDVLAEKAIHLIADNWRALTESSARPQTHDAMCLAAVLGGINVGNAGTCLPHRLQQAMASVTRLQVSHSRGLAAVYPAWLRKARAHAPKRFARVASWLSGTKSSDPELEIRMMIRTMGLADSLGALGFITGDVDQICANISGNIGNDPIEGLDTAAIRSMIADAIIPPAETLIPQ